MFMACLLMRLHLLLVYALGAPQHTIPMTKGATSFEARSNGSNVSTSAAREQRQSPNDAVTGSVLFRAPIPQPRQLPVQQPGASPSLPHQRAPDTTPSNSRRAGVRIASTLLLQQHGASSSVPCQPAPDKLRSSRMGTTSSDSAPDAASMIITFVLAVSLLAASIVVFAQLPAVGVCHVRRRVPQTCGASGRAARQLVRHSVVVLPMLMLACRAQQADPRPVFRVVYYVEHLIFAERWTKLEVKNGTSELKMAFRDLIDPQRCVGGDLKLSELQIVAACKTLDTRVSPECCHIVELASYVTFMSRSLNRRVGDVGAAKQHLYAALLSAVSTMLSWTRGAYVLVATKRSSVIKVGVFRQASLTAIRSNIKVEFDDVQAWREALASFTSETLILVLDVSERHQGVCHGVGDRQPGGSLAQVFRARPVGEIVVDLAIAECWTDVEKNDLLYRFSVASDSIEPQNCAGRDVKIREIVLLYMTSNLAELSPECRHIMDLVWYAAFMSTRPHRWTGYLEGAKRLHAELLSAVSASMSLTYGAYVLIADQHFGTVDARVATQAAWAAVHFDAEEEEELGQNGSVMSGAANVFQTVEFNDVQAWHEAVFNLTSVTLLLVLDMSEHRRGVRHDMAELDKQAASRITQVVQDEASGASARGVVHDGPLATPSPVEMSVPAENVGTNVGTVGKAASTIPWRSSACPSVRQSDAVLWAEQLSCVVVICLSILWEVVVSVRGRRAHPALQQGVVQRLPPARPSGVVDATPDMTPNAATSNERSSGTPGLYVVTKDTPAAATPLSTGALPTLNSQYRPTTSKASDGNRRRPARSLAVPGDQQLPPQSLWEHLALAAVDTPDAIRPPAPPAAHNKAATASRAKAKVKAAKAAIPAAADLPITASEAVSSSDIMPVIRAGADSTPSYNPVAATAKSTGVPADNVVAPTHPVSCTTASAAKSSTESSAPLSGGLPYKASAALPLWLAAANPALISHLRRSMSPAAVPPVSSPRRRVSASCGGQVAAAAPQQAPPPLVSKNHLNNPVKGLLPQPILSTNAPPVQHPVLLSIMHAVPNDAATDSVGQAPRSVFVEEEEACCICLDAPRTVALLHGNNLHLCLCEACAARCAKVGGECMMCRSVIEDIVTVQQE